MSNLASSSCMERELSANKTVFLWGRQFSQTAGGGGGVVTGGGTFGGGVGPYFEVKIMLTF